MPKQVFRNFGVWPETHRVFKRLSFENDKPIAQLAHEAVQLLQSHYAAQQPVATATAQRRRATDPAPQPTTAA